MVEIIIILAMSNKDLIYSLKHYKSYILTDFFPSFRKRSILNQHLQLKKNINNQIHHFLISFLVY